MKGILCFADGTVYKGLGLGTEGEGSGILAHFHGPFDPQFLLTDPAVKDLFILSTEPAVGNCGIRSGVDQSDNIWASGLICREIVDFPTHDYHFKNVHRLLESQGGRALTYLDPDPLAGLARDEPRSTMLIGPEHRLSERSRRLIVRELRRDHDIDGWDMSASVKRETELICQKPQGRILLIDLGIRSGILGYLREHYDIRMINPADIEKNLPFDSFDGLVISGGSGQLPSGELMGYLDGLTVHEHPPIYAYGIGALALGASCGLEIIDMEIPHRGMSIPVTFGDRTVPTYQTHSRSFSQPPPDWMVTGRCPVDSTIESMNHPDRSIHLSMFDPAPDLRKTGPSDPLSTFMGDIMGGGSR